jgi:hypothetical protein
MTSFSSSVSGARTDALRIVTLQYVTHQTANCKGRQGSNLAVTVEPRSAAAKTAGRESRNYFARPVYPCAIAGITMIRFRALGVPHVP